MEANRKASAAAATLAVERGGGAWQEEAALLKVIIRISWGRNPDSTYPGAGYQDQDQDILGQELVFLSMTIFYQVRTGLGQRENQNGRGQARRVRFIGIQKYEIWQMRDSYFPEE